MMVISHTQVSLVQTAWGDPVLLPAHEKYLQNPGLPVRAECCTLAHELAKSLRPLSEILPGAQK